MSFHPQRLLITGAAGFIGTNFTRWVAHTHPDIELVAVDALTYAGRRDNLTGVPHTFHHLDVTDRAQLRQVMVGCDAVVHFAAESHVDRSIDGADDFLTSNIIGANAVFDVARHLQVERLLHISTDEVYGSIDVGSWPEGHPLQPNSPYATSKAAADLLARAHHITHDYPILVTRTANNFGPYQHVEKFLPRSITRLLTGKPVAVYGNGQNERDWTFVTDNVTAQWKVLTEGTPGQVYNVGAGNEQANLTIARTLLNILGLEAATHLQFVEDRPGHDQRYSVDTTKIRALGWAPETTFADALTTTVEWYQRNRSWWDTTTHTTATRRRGLRR